MEKQNTIQSHYSDLQRSSDRIVAVTLTAAIICKVEGPTFRSVS